MHFLKIVDLAGDFTSEPIKTGQFMSDNASTSDAIFCKPGKGCYNSQGERAIAQFAVLIHGEVVIKQHSFDANSSIVEYFSNVFCL